MKDEEGADDGMGEVPGCAGLLALVLSAAIAFAVLVALVILLDLRLPARAFPL